MSRWTIFGCFCCWWWWWRGGHRSHQMQETHCWMCHLQARLSPADRAEQTSTRSSHSATAVSSRSTSSSAESSFWIQVWSQVCSNECLLSSEALTVCSGHKAHLTIASTTFVLLFWPISQVAASLHLAPCSHRYQNLLEDWSSLKQKSRFSGADQSRRGSNLYVCSISRHLVAEVLSCSNNTTSQRQHLNNTTNCGWLLNFNLPP